MAPLSRTNKYLKDKSQLAKIVTENAIASSVFEGASNRIARTDQSAASRSFTASAKKRSKSA